MKIIKAKSKRYGEMDILVDDIDYPHLVKYHWVIDRSRQTFYAYNRGQDPAGKLIKWKMHRVLLGLTDNKLVGDHKDGNGLNNQRHNLRTATLAENSRNRRPVNSPFKGVNKDSYKSKIYYKSTITYNGKRIHLGCFKTAEEAALAYNEAALKYHGEFAYQNPV